MHPRDELVTEHTKICVRTLFGLVLWNMCMRGLTEESTICMESDNKHTIFICNNCSWGGFNGCMHVYSNGFIHDHMFWSKLSCCLYCQGMPSPRACVRPEGRHREDPGGVWCGQEQGSAAVHHPGRQRLHRWWRKACGLEGPAHWKGHSIHSCRWVLFLFFFSSFCSYDAAFLHV